MSQERLEDEPSKFTMILFALGVIALGYPCVWPDAAAEATASGRRSTLKPSLSFVGPPLVWWSASSVV